MEWTILGDRSLIHPLSRTSPKWIRKYPESSPVKVSRHVAVHVGTLANELLGEVAAEGLSPPSPILACRGLKTRARVLERGPEGDPRPASPVRGSTRSHGALSQYIRR